MDTSISIAELTDVMASLGMSMRYQAQIRSPHHTSVGTTNTNAANAPREALAHRLP